MVASLGLFEAFEVFGQFLFRGEGGTVDSLKLFILLIAAVIGTSDGEQLECFDLLGVVDVRAGAEIEELAVLVEADLLAFGDVVEAAELVALLADGLDLSDRFLA